MGQQHGDYSRDFFSVGIPPGPIVGTKTKTSREVRINYVSRWIKDFWKSKQEFSWKEIIKIFKMANKAVRNETVFADFFTADGIFIEEQ